MNESVWGRLCEHRRDRGGQPAVVAAGIIWSYEQLLGRVEASAIALRNCGIGTAAVVGLTLDDEVEHLVATLALLAVGARQIVLASHDAPSLRAQIAARVGVTHLLSADTASTVAGAGFVCWPPARPWPQASTEAWAPVPPEAVLYLKTSGTTGEMNIVAFSEAQLAAQAQRHLDYRNERLLRLASIEHNNSKRHRLYGVWAGGTNVFRPQGESVVEFALRHGVTCLDISRMHAADLAASDDAHRLAGIKLRTGGSSIPTALRRGIVERVTASFYVRYAATECGAIAMALPGDHDGDETSGRPLPGVDVQIVGADGSVLPSGCSGEIRLRAAGMATGYVNNPEQSASRFRQGWFHPGDVGCLRADGQLVVQGRADDMIVLNGLNIFPAEIERVLEAHPSVAEAAAFPLWSKIHGQIPVAAVELRHGAQTSPVELQRFSRSQLGLRTPRRIVIVSPLPKNSQGKVLKKVLAQSFHRVEDVS